MIATVTDGATPVAKFVGLDAEDRAAGYIGTLPGAETGRYGLDVSDDSCDSCHATFSREARDETPEGWACPECGEVEA